jgi:SAM-dependent methyltransferase
MSFSIPVETRIYPEDATRARKTDRPWYRYAARLLPATAGRWIDLGCGQGEFLELASARGLAGLGLDYWAPSAAAAAAGPGRGAVVADLNRSLPFRSGSLDGASLIEVVEHIMLAEDLLAEVGRVVRPGGWLVVTTPNVAYLPYRRRALTGYPPKQEGYHYRFFTRGTLRAAVERAGFAHEASASFGRQSLLSRLGRLAGRGPKYRVRYRVPDRLEALLAEHFVWRLRRVP